MVSFPDNLKNRIQWFPQHFSTRITHQGLGNGINVCHPPGDICSDNRITDGVQGNFRPFLGFPE